MILYGYLSSLGYGILCILLGALAYKLGVNKKYSRKIVHILVGFEWLILYHFMEYSYHFLIVCLIFTILLLVSYLKKIFKMMDSDDDNAPGTVYYGVAMSLMAIFTLIDSRFMLPFGVGVLCTSLGDGFAGFVGQLVKKYNPKIYFNKTLYGALANFSFSFFSLFILNSQFEMGLEIWQGIAIAFLSTVVELISKRGLDNLFIPISTSLLTYGFLNLPEINHYIVPILLTPVVVALVNSKRALTRLALVFALVLDLVITLTLGNFGFVILLSFLVLSIAIDKIKKNKKSSLEISKKSECRDHIQVMANGLVPMLLAVLFSISFEKAFIVAYVSTLAEAFADTAASGFGSYSKKTFDPFKMKAVENGLSGGMSFIGTASAIVASFALPLIAVLFGAINIDMYIIASLSAFFGVIIDSLLGSLVQVKYKCPSCGKITERDVHCKKRTQKYSGFSFFDNDVVNITSNFATAIAAIAFYCAVL